VFCFVFFSGTWGGGRVKYPVDNGMALEHGLASLFRAAAMFLTNKENMVAQNGDFDGTQVNSDRQLW
jgi:hypothetical protein